MASLKTLRVRRSAAQRHALEKVEREIRATDPHLRRKYLRDFSEAFQTYEDVLTAEQLKAIYSEGDILLVGDYHALPASQQYAADLVRQLAMSGRKVVLGVEFVFARDQHILDEWLAGEIEGEELCQRIRFDIDWGYEWGPFYRLMVAGRDYAERVYGLDCLPRNDLRKIMARDRHAAAKVEEVRDRHPDAVVVVLFGESHLAPTHLPELLRTRRPQDRILTVLQNVDPLYWKAAGEPRDRVEAVKVNDDVVCVFNSTPLEKYESYRICIERWRQERPAGPDLAPSFFNIVSALLRFLNIDVYSPTTGTQPGFLVDQLPEVYSQVSGERIRKLLLRRGADDAEVLSVNARLEANGTCYVPRLNAVFVREFNLVNGAEEAARFLHKVSRGGLCTSPAQDVSDEHSERKPRDSQQGNVSTQQREDLFYTRVLEEALAYFGSRALYPGRTPIRELDLYSLYSHSRETVEEMGFCSYHEYMQMVDFLVLHKDYEANCRYYRERPLLLNDGVGWVGERAEFLTQWLGQMLGSQIYDAYVSGVIAKRFIRSLFVRNLQKPGTARTVYFVTVRRLRQQKKRPAY
jgi:hypothetical protein